MNIQTVCVAHVLASVVIYLCTNKLCYIFNHQQKLGSAYVKPHICNNMSSLQRFAAKLKGCCSFPCTVH